MGVPSTYPTNTTKYIPEKCFNGFTIFPVSNVGAVLIDMNGKPVHIWRDLQGFPNKILPGGVCMGHLGMRDKNVGHQDYTDVVAVDWDGNVIWKFDHTEFIEDPGMEAQWMARAHHDYQVAGNPVGYYAPGMEPTPGSGKSLILSHIELTNEEISLYPLVDDLILEVDAEGNHIWEWKCSDHFNEFGFDETQKNTIFRNPNFIPAGGKGDWAHINCASYLGPNKWYDAGDERFHPDNIICDSREANVMFIISRKTGKIVWKIGPDYTASRELRIMGVMVGMHHTHMIPRGLPGEGNILVFDNGGWGGYGAPSQISKSGIKDVHRDYSRVLEIDPTTLKVVWEFSATPLYGSMPFVMHKFYSPFISSAQRLPNGNTLITEGATARLLEVTPEHEIVWEYIYPYENFGIIYRAYRCPYAWVPQVTPCAQVPVTPPENCKFTLPGSHDGSYDDSVIVKIEDTLGFDRGETFCVEKVD